ncbi:TAT-variant-translocated molybdopterin oxidoreductase [Schlesneria sp. T3-172]|uniref:TAT-variant-translocated molybdopterin oxidoreductase n=1 Tax=Schlesneria sphaerica TaxID=3373610 RepID=UPI0037CC27D3
MKDSGHVRSQSAPADSDPQNNVRSLDLDDLLNRLETTDPPPLWRGLEELAESPEFFDYLHREFPRQASEWTDESSRRDFLRLAAASLGLAGVGLSGCVRQPAEKIVPYVRQPEDMIPGKPQYFATCMTRGGYATGLLVESHLGRPTKIEGNPDHPASLGGTDVFAQASILSLYDPDRSQTLMKAGRISTWSEFLSKLTLELNSLRPAGGKGLVILTEATTSPTLLDQLRSLREDLPELTWIQYSPVSRGNVRAGAIAAFRQPVDVVYQFDRAKTILSLDADFLTSMPGSLRYTRDFIDRRRAGAADPHAVTMNRLYTVESTPSLTGAQADHRLALRAFEIETVARILAQQLGIEVATPVEVLPPAVPAKWLEALLSDLQEEPGASLVIPGDGQPAAVHALAHAINRQLGNVGKTVRYIPALGGETGDQIDSLRELVTKISQGNVKMLIVIGGNPVYNTPGELNFAEAYRKVPFRVHLAPEYDETSYESHWHIPRSHTLEAWSDACACDGTCSIQQPLIAPLYETSDEHQLIAVLAGRAELTAYEIVRNYWKRQWGRDDFEDRWRRAVHDGVIASSSAEDIRPEWKFVDKVTPTRATTTARDAATVGLEVTFVPDPTIWDGSFANNGWLQELPKPITKLTWDNAALISPRTARRLGVENAELVDLTIGEKSIRVPVLIVPGQPDDSLSLSLGYGRTRSGRIGNGAGFNAYPIRPATSDWFTTGGQLKKTGRLYDLSITQSHHSMEGRDLVQIQTLPGYAENPDFISPEMRHPHELPSLYPESPESPNAWGMVIDQTACVGCNACVVACQAENNIPIVGKKQVRMGREMHWLRIDRYYRGQIADPETYFQPMMCVHCEKAPCELVCPVAATVHSHDGLNQMIYNRCVGTRYCSNNCPYKVRRFNFLDYDAEIHYDATHAPSLKLMRNPDVTVRSRGVMEKCTYCTQRISHARIEARKQSRDVIDGEIVTACQQACPAQAITFGDLNDPASAVTQLKKSPLNYSLLAELNTRPRTTHLARLRNPHPRLAGLATEDTPPWDGRSSTQQEEK